MHIRQAEHSEFILSTPSYPTSIVIPPSQTSSGSGNGILNFSVALGGILIVTIVTGIIVYLYRKKLHCRQKMNSKSSKGSSGGSISCIMDYYSNDYILNPKKVNNKSISNKKNNASESAITNNITNDVTIKSNKTENNTMKSFKSHIGEFYTRNSNKIINLNLSRSKSEIISGNDAIENHKSKSTKSVKSPFISTSDDKNKISSEYSVPQISSPISMPSASIYDIERANNLANSLSRSTAFQVQAPPIPPFPVHPHDKQSKEVERNSKPKSNDNTRETSISKLNSFYNLIPLIFMNSETTTTTTTTEVSPNVNNIGVDSPSPTIPQHKITITPPVGVIPDWSKAPWHDDLNFNNKDNRNINNNYYYNNSNYNDDYYYNGNDDDKDDNDNDDDDTSTRYNNDSERSSRYSSEDLIRFSNASKLSKNRIGGSPLKQTEIMITQDNNSKSSERKTNDKITGDFVKELKLNIEKNPEKFEFLKNPAENHNNWKRNGNFFEYRLQRSKTII